MKTAQLTKDYTTWLKGYGIHYREEGAYLQVGTTAWREGWVLLISATTTDFQILAHQLLPFLLSKQVPFAMVKNTLAHYMVNTGWLEEAYIGKICVVFPEDIPTAVSLAGELIALTAGYSGMVIPQALSLGELVYAAYALSSTEGLHETKWRLPKTHPFGKKATYPPKRIRVLAHSYIPVQYLKRGPKGDIYKAVNICKLAFAWCLIKQGKQHAADDDQGRTIRDRLLWQKHVLKDLAGKVPAPKVLDFEEVGRNSYLVTEYFEGMPLLSKIHHLLNRRNWKQLPSGDKIQLLQLYQQALEIVSAIHQQGYLHRDLSDANFMVSSGGQLRILDFELAYSLKDRLPNPPFVFGTNGYMSPQQTRAELPTIGEDVYALGALLSVFLTGIRPCDTLVKDKKAFLLDLRAMTANPELSNLVKRCVRQLPEERPSLGQMQQIIQKQLNTYVL